MAWPALFVLLWSTGFIGAKLGVPYVEPFTFLSLRFVIVLALMVPLTFIVRARWPSSWAEARHIAVAGLMIQAGYLGGCFAAVYHGMSAGVVALFVGVQPIMTAFAAAPLFGDRITRVQWLGLVLGFTGVVLVVWKNVSFDSAGWLAVVGAVVSVTSMAGGTLYQKRFCPQFDLRSGSVIQFTASLLLLLPLAYLTETMEVRWTGEFLFALGWLVFVLSIGAISLLFKLIEHGEATRVASLFYLVPPTTALMAYFVFGETLDALALAGMAIGIVGVALVVRRAAVAIESAKLNA